MRLISNISKSFKAVTAQYESKHTRRAVEASQPWIRVTTALLHQIQVLGLFLYYQGHPSGYQEVHLLFSSTSKYFRPQKPIKDYTRTGQGSG